MRKWLRYLRISFSVLCGIFCLLLIALWVRSFWRVDTFTHTDTWLITKIFTVSGRYLVLKDPNRLPGENPEDRKRGWSYSSASPPPNGSDAHIWLGPGQWLTITPLGPPIFLLAVLTLALALAPLVPWPWLSTRRQNNLSATYSSASAQKER